MNKNKMSLNEYISYRLGADKSKQIKIMMQKSFCSSSFSQFWKYWNPTYGYILYKYCYYPLSKFSPRFINVILTFAASGFFLHDFPFNLLPKFLISGKIGYPFVTIWFITIGLFVMIAEKISFSMESRSTSFKIFANIMHIFLPFAASFFLS